METRLYFYHTAQGNAVLDKGDDMHTVKIGKFKTEAEALKACKAHHAKASAFLEKVNKPVPQAFFM